MTRPMPWRARCSGSAAWYSGGYVIAPTPTMTPWSGMSRGTDCRVPSVPGLVSVTVVPAKSSGVSLFARVFLTTSS